jgi:hypothetical protein
MAKTTAPLLSMGASGQIGKTQVYGSWRGTSYARRYVIPANPQTQAQTDTRNIFLWLNEAWKVLSPSVQAVWTAFAKGKPMTDRNAWQQTNLPDLRVAGGVPAVNLETLDVSPGVNAGLAAGGIATADAGGHNVTVTMTPPALPAGWAITHTHAVAFKTQNASVDKFYTSYYAKTDGAVYDPAPACGAAGTYDVFGFFEYTKPDGSVAYSPSLHATQVLA